MEKGASLTILGRFRAYAIIVALAVVGNTTHGLAQNAAPLGAGIDFGSYHALVIGNNDYAHLPKLKTAVADARAIAELLRERYNFSVQLVLNATREDVIRALLELRGKLGENDSLLIYYAGYGYLDSLTDTGFWLPVDAHEDNEANWVSVSTLSRNLRAIWAKHIMIVADSCYSGTLTRAAPVHLPSPREQMELLRRMAEKRSVTAMSSGGLEPVADSGGGNHSVFAKAFMTTLNENDTILRGELVFDRVRSSVVVNADQTPEYGDVRLADHQGGDFLFVPTNLPQAPVVVAAATVQLAPEPSVQRGQEIRETSNIELERSFWELIKDSEDPAMFAAFLEQFPNGTLAPLARIMVNKYSKAKAVAPTESASPKAAPQQAAIPSATEVAPLDKMYEVIAPTTPRIEPKIAAKRLSPLAPGTIVRVTGVTEDGVWFRIEGPEETGFALTELLRDAPNAPPTVAPGGTRVRKLDDTYRLLVDTDIRDAPAMRSGKLGRETKDTDLRVTGILETQDW